VLRVNKNARILAVCEAGEDRSAAFATELKHHRGYNNVLNCGITNVDMDTFAMLAKWADVIYVVADPTVWRRIPATFKGKAKFVDVGFDIWHSPTDVRLLRIIREKCDALGL
jgi:hypothetical protein